MPPVPRYAPNVDTVFHKTLIGCDKIIIRDGSFNPAEECYSNKALIILDDPCSIYDFVDAIRFSCFQREAFCACSGWPGIDFYKNGEIIMATSVKHNIALHTPLIDYDAQVTNGTSNFFEGLVTGLNRAASAPAEDIAPEPNDANSPQE